VFVPLVFQAKRYTGLRPNISEEHSERGYQFNRLRQVPEPPGVPVAGMDDQHASRAPLGGRWIRSPGSPRAPTLWERRIGSPRLGRLDNPNGGTDCPPCSVTRRCRSGLRDEAEGKHETTKTEPNLARNRKFESSSLHRCVFSPVERRGGKLLRQVAAFSTMSAAFSPIMIDGALVLPDVSVGMIEASATRRPAMPCRLQYLSGSAQLRGNRAVVLRSILLPA
jgi:hypothetical protein